MATIAVGDAVGEGFNLIRHRFGAVLVWGAIRIAYAVGAFALMAPLYLSQFGAILARAKGSVPTPPDVQSMMAMRSANLLQGLIGGVMLVVLYCAVFRSVLKPDEGRFAYLRVGMSEVFMFLLAFGAVVTLVIAAAVLIVPVAVLIGILAAVHAGAAATLVAILGGLAIIVLFVWVFLRFSLVGPMTVDDGKFHLADAWSLSRGRALDLFVIGLVLFVILLLIELVVGAFFIAIGFAFLSQAAGGLNGIQGFFTRPPAEIFSTLSPALIVFAVVGIPLTGCLMAIVAAPWARAYRNLVGPEPVASVF
ncbi:MAG TPA: hypothetical protein VGF33_02015 [Caulobacteraceae bacterium]